MRKRILSIILVACILLSLLPAAALAAGTTDGQQSALSFYVGTNSIITKNGDLYVYGDMTSGELEIFLKDVKKADTGYLQVAAIKTNGDLYVWGHFVGSIMYLAGGFGNTIDGAKVLSHVSDVCLGAEHGGAITEDGSLYMWGGNENGEVGTGTTKDQFTPVKVLSDVAAVSLSDDGNYCASHSAAITKDGSLYMWGGNRDGQLGNGTTQNQLKPVKILSDVISVDTSAYNTAAVTKDGSLYLWGSNSYGQIGNGTTQNQLKPTKILSNVAMVDLDDTYCAAVTKDGSLYLWGSNSRGQIGNGTTQNQLKPIKILSNIDFVDLGNCHSAALTRNGDLYMWGENDAGQIGNGTKNNQLVPLKIMSDVVDVCCDELVGAVKSNGDLYTWGHESEFTMDAYLTLSPQKTLSNVYVPSGKNEIKVILNGKQIQFDQPPVIRNNRVMVPIRAVAEAMGDEVKWNNQLKAALITHPDKLVIFKNGASDVYIYIDPTDISTWDVYKFDVSPQIINGRTLTPVRAIAECLGAKVSWDESTRTVNIEYAPNPEKTLKENAEAQLNAYYSVQVETDEFSRCSAEITDFYNSRDNKADSYIIWWDNWTLSLEVYLSGEKTDVYMLKNCLAEIFSELPEVKEYNIDAHIEIEEWLTSAMAYGSYIDFTKITNTATGMSAQTANAIAKVFHGIDKAGLTLQLTGASLQALCSILSDYTESILYVDALRNALKESNIKNQVIYDALDSLEADYTNKVVSSLAKGASKAYVITAEYLISTASSGLYSFASFCKTFANSVVGNDDKAAALRDLNCIYLFNDQIDKAYSKIYLEVAGDPEKIDDYIMLYNFQKAMKIKMYKAMDVVRKKSDEYTKNRIQEQIEKLNNCTYIIWE